VDFGEIRGIKHHELGENVWRDTSTLSPTFHFYLLKLLNFYDALFKVLLFGFHKSSPLYKRGWQRKSGDCVSGIRSQGSGFQESGIRDQGSGIRDQRSSFKREFALANEVAKSSPLYKRGWQALA
jgi:hypothetical protein